MGKKSPHAVIIIENMTVPPDRRVWQQACALRDDGWRVSVISPKLGAFQAPHEIIEGVEIYRHPLLIEARTIAGYALEYSGALACELHRLVALDLNDIDVLQICNPPDFLFAPALMAKKFGKAKVVFDHHDLTPELLIEKTGSAKGPLLSFARWAEKMTFKIADRVISTNSSFRDHALSSGLISQQDVNIVYSSPDLERLRAGNQKSSLKKGAAHLLFWVGVIGSQDGLDILLDAMAHLRTLPGGDDFHLLIAGDGPERAVMEARSRMLDLDDLVTFAGFLSGDDLADAFATADIGVGSDPKNDFNDRLAMNKVLEYMAYNLPMAMFDLNESRKIAGDSAFYASNNDPAALAACISNLIESPAVRSAMGARGRTRLETSYSWETQKQRYLDVYRSIIEAR
ncbi:MAG: glycosyltransferase family 4 protein [Marinicaulis sp.]|nr:glycosyltransferase family 4 protein [Marinicaulis sp.]NNE40566.1 glycosyltransferase family 4 protein [Marinicaulis sp.]